MREPEVNTIDSTYGACDLFVEHGACYCSTGLPGRCPLETHTGMIVCPSPEYAAMLDRRIREKA